jgi:uncharacterized protein YndB with AHSA1/START domain
VSAVPEIDPNAPVRNQSEIEIEASPEAVWAALTDFERWPSWNPEVKSISIDGPVQPGTVFRWKSGPGTIVSELQTVDPPHTISWTGKTMSIRAFHVWSLEPRDGKTIVKSDETFQGTLARIFRGPLQKAVDKAFDDSLPRFKAQVERGSQST